MVYQNILTPCLETPSFNFSAYLNDCIQFTFHSSIPLAGEGIISLYYSIQSHNQQVDNDTLDTTWSTHQGILPLCDESAYVGSPPNQVTLFVLVLTQRGFSCYLSLRAYYVSDIVLNTSYMSSSLVFTITSETRKIMPIYRRGK